MTTLNDVADRAGVSKSTVSNVIRGTALVAAATRARVERAIAETGYHPNAIARSLKSRASMAIGIVVPDLTNPYYAQLAVGVERAALVVVGASLVWLASQTREPRHHSLAVWAMVLVAAGGAGNLVDRVVRDGRVIDFMNLGLGPVRTGIFNVADVQIMVGLGLLLLGRRGLNTSRAPT